MTVDTVAAVVPVQRQPGQDWHLVERAQAGDKTAFAELYTLHDASVRKFVRFRVGFSNHALADDLASEVWARALRFLPKVSYQGVSYGAWLITIARNLIADHFKSHRYKKEVTTGDVLDVDRPDMPERQTDALAVTYLTSVDLLAVVQKLTGDQYEVIVLRYLRGLSVTETAAVMGKGEGAVKALTYRAVGALRRMLPPPEVTQ